MSLTLCRSEHAALAHRQLCSVWPGASATFRVYVEPDNDDKSPPEASDDAPTNASPEAAPEVATSQPPPRWSITADPHMAAILGLPCPSTTNEAGPSSAPVPTPQPAVEGRGRGRGRGSRGGGRARGRGRQAAPGRKVEAACSAISQVRDLRMLGRGDVIQKRQHMDTAPVGDVPIRMGYQLKTCVVDTDLAAKMLRSQKIAKREERPYLICDSVEKAHCFGTLGVGASHANA
jgi:hypothetical protein